MASAGGTQVKVCGYDILLCPLFCKATGAASLLLDVKKVAEQLSPLVFRQCHFNKIREDKCMQRKKAAEIFKMSVLFGFLKDCYFLQCCSSSKSLGACICSLLDARPLAEKNISHQVLCFFHLDLKCQIMQSFESGSKGRMQEVKDGFCLHQHRTEKNHPYTTSVICIVGPTEQSPEQTQSWEVD